MYTILSKTFCALYFGVAFLLMLYGLNCYVMIRIFRRRYREAARQREEMRRRHPPEELLARTDLPPVTTQIPVYNEFNVVERIMRAVCAMAYPAGLHEIQILDDSTDETRDEIDRVAEDLQQMGHDIRVIRRPDRVGFKAGALANGLKTAKGQFVALFDADFVPPQDYWLHTIPYFLEDPKLGLVQARWGHINRKSSLLTRTQGIGIDGHFVVEQGGRTWNRLFMNFNGTAGVWRRAAIDEAGGWQHDTLTEDMDLSYRVQLAGWTTQYLLDVVVPAEIPEDMRAFKNQQFRWAKGSIQTAKKMLPAVLRSDASWFKKMQAAVHLTQYMVHPLMLLLAVGSLPILLLNNLTFSPLLFSIFAVAIVLAMAGPNVLYILSQNALHRDWPRRLIYLPALVVIGVGLAFNNSRAVFEALIGRESGFIRTPKRGDRETKRYRVNLPWPAMVELSLGLYCAVTFTLYVLHDKVLAGQFIAIYSAGFLFAGLTTLIPRLPQRRRVPNV